MEARQRPAIVLPLDGSVTSAAAFGPARALARILEGVLHVVHVTDQPMPEHRLARYLQITPMEEDFVFHQVKGEVAGAILDLATSAGAWMIVMSGQGQTNDPERMAGQTALSLIQRSTFPVMVIRATMREVPGPEWRPTRMLVPLEGSPLADCVIKQVFSLAQDMKIDLDILHIAVAKKKPPMEVGGIHQPTLPRPSPVRLAGLERGVSLPLLHLPPPRRPAPPLPPAGQAGHGDPAFRHGEQRRHHRPLLARPAPRQAGGDGARGADPGRSPGPADTDLTGNLGSDPFLNFSGMLLFTFSF